MYEQRVDPTASCENLLLSGNRNPGYYFVDSGSKDTVELVMCNMDFEVTDPTFQVPTSIKLAKTPVAFDFYRNSTTYVNGASNGTIVRYEHVLTSHGDAMDVDGVFVAPIDGVYTFTLSYIEDESGNGYPSEVELRVDGELVAKIRSSHSSSSNTGNVGQTMVVSLSKGQEVVAAVTRGYLGSSKISGPYIHFTGHLLFPV